MGNLPFTAVGSEGSKRQEIHEFAESLLRTFTLNYTRAYSQEYVKHLLGEVEEKEKPVVGAYRMMHRDIHSLQKPKKTGMLTKRGAIVKNWKHRFFVVKSNYTIEYYENEESFKKGAKPKGTIYPSGYKVVKDMENEMLQRTRKLAEKMGVDVGEIPAPDKYPEHSFELYHQRRRVWIMTAHDEDDKENWCDVLEDCCYHGCGLKNEDPIARKAFPLAMRWTRFECGSGVCSAEGGTEEQVLSDFIVAEVSSRTMNEIYSNIKGNWTIRCKLKEQVDKALDSAVMALVTPTLKTVDAGTQQLKQNLDVLIAQRKDELAAVERKVMWEMNEQIKAHVDKPLNESRADIDKILGIIKDPVEKAFDKCREIFIEAAAELEKKLKEMPELNLELNADEVLDNIDSTYDNKGRYANYCVEEMFKPLYATDYPLFPILICGRNIAKLMLDSAVYTFQELFMDSAKETEAMSNGEDAAKLADRIKDNVVEQFNCDVSVALHFFLFKSLVCAIENKLHKELDPVCEPLIKPIKSVIPSALESVLSVRDMYEKYVHNAVEDLILKVLKEKDLEPPQVSEDEVEGKSKSVSSNEEQSTSEEKESNEEQLDHTNKCNDTSDDKEAKSELNEGDQECTENGEVDQKPTDEENSQDVKEDDQSQSQETNDTENVAETAEKNEENELAPADISTKL